MTKSSSVILAVLLAASSSAMLLAEEQLPTLTGSCSLTAASKADEVDLRLKRGKCQDNRDCGSTQTQEPLGAFLGFTLADLEREGAHVDAVIRAEAGISAPPVEDRSTSRRSRAL